MNMEIWLPDPTNCGIFLCSWKPSSNEEFFLLEETFTCWVNVPHLAERNL